MAADEINFLAYLIRDYLAALPMSAPFRTITQIAVDNGMHPRAVQVAVDFAEANKIVRRKRMGCGRKPAFYLYVDGFEI